MCHYDKNNDSKKKTCSLTPNYILGIIINDDTYKKILYNVIENRYDLEEREYLMEILLNKYKFPIEFAIQKALQDIKEIINSKKVKDNHLFLNLFGTLTPDQIENLLLAWNSIYYFLLYHPKK
jgi:hypothetical protein